jgi:hypothetical protein
VIEVEIARAEAHVEKAKAETVIEKMVMREFDSDRDSDDFDVVRLHLPSAQNLSKHEQMVMKTQR